MFVVLALQDFEFEPSPKSLYKSLPVSVDAGKMIGYLPIYSTREDALMDFPNSRLCEIQLAKGGK